MNQRVLVASNRGPVSYQFGTDGSLTTSRGGGGMIAGVTDGLAALGPEASTTWICAALSDADRAVARSLEARDAGPRDSEPIAVRMLDIDPLHFDFSGDMGDTRLIVETMDKRSNILLTVLPRI